LAKKTLPKPTVEGLRSFEPTMVRVCSGCLSAFLGGDETELFDCCERLSREIVRVVV
jgi:hypothetical protein